MSSIPNIPAQSIPNSKSIPSGFDGPFYQEIDKRKSQNRDAKILVTAKDGQTGIGKSNLCDFLGYVLDTSDTGFGTEKTAIEPQRFLELYNELPPGSTAIMEEGEQFDSRRAMTNENVDASQKWQMARVREIVALVNLPSPEEIDSRFERLADYWINVETRGRARVYKKKIHPIKRFVYYETLQKIKWPNMDDSPTFQEMATMKEDHLDDESTDDNWMRESEVEERIKKCRKDTRQEVRNEWVCGLKESGMSGADISRLPHVDLTVQRVNQIARENSLSNT